MVEELRVLSATGALGATPMDEDSFWRGVERRPHVIGADAGSNDVGPYGLGANLCYFPREWVKHDLRLMLMASRKHGVPMVVGTAGHMGTDSGVDYHVSILDEVAREERLPAFRLARIYTELDKAAVRRALDAGDLAPLDGAPALTHDAIDATNHVVGVIGVEPYLEAFHQGADVIIAGRSCDDAIFASYPIFRGFDRPLSIHLGKVLECASVAATPYMARNAMMGTIRRDAIRFEPMNPQQVCTPVSVAAHSMYEEAHPHLHRVPGGVVHLEGCTFTQVDERTVEVAGAILKPVELRLKIEGAGFAGYRFVGILGIRDPLTIENLDAFLAFAEERLRSRYPQWVRDRDYELHTHFYGVNATMKSREPLRADLPHEVGVVIEAVSKDEELARLICRLYRKSLMVAEYPGQKATTGKAAIMADEELRGMDAYRWTIYHTMRVSDPMAHARIDIGTVGGNQA
jgi:hypothetical protein